MLAANPENQAFKKAFSKEISRLTSDHNDHSNPETGILNIMMTSNSATATTAETTSTPVAKTYDAPLRNFAGVVVSVESRTRASKSGEKIDLLARLEKKFNGKTVVRSVRVLDGAPKAVLQSVLVVGAKVNLYGIYETFDGKDGKKAQIFKALGVAKARPAKEAVAG